MYIYTNDTRFSGKIIKFGEIKVPLYYDQDKLYFKNWQNDSINVDGSNKPKTDYVKDIEYKQLTERGTLKNCFVDLSPNEDFVTIYYVSNIKINLTQNISDDSNNSQCHLDKLFDELKNEMIKHYENSSESLEYEINYHLKQFKLLNKRWNDDEVEDEDEY